MERIDYTAGRLPHNVWIGKDAVALLTQLLVAVGQLMQVRLRLKAQAQLRLNNSIVSTQARAEMYGILLKFACSSWDQRHPVVWQQVAQTQATASHALKRHVQDQSSQQVNLHDAPVAG